MTLKEMREAAGYASQKAAADAADLHQTTISDLEEGSARDVRASTLTSLAKIYARSLDEVLTAIAESRNEVAS